MTFRVNLLVGRVQQMFRSAVKGDGRVSKKLSNPRDRNQRSSQQCCVKQQAIAILHLFIYLRAA